MGERFPVEVAIALPVLLCISIILHEVGHALAFISLDIPYRIDWFPPRVSMVDSEYFPVWWDHRVAIGVAGGLFAFAVLIVPSYLLHPASTFIAHAQLTSGLIEPYHSLAVVYCPNAGFDILYIFITVFCAILLTIFTIILRWHYEL